MSGRRVRWLIFLSCGVLLALALGWTTWAALRLERTGFEERVQNLELEVRNMALARIDAYVTTLLARENQRPMQDFLSFYEPSKAFTLDARVVDPIGYYQRSPLCAKRPENEFVRRYFTLMPDGTISSPELPQDDFRELALSQGFVDEESLARAEADLAWLAGRLSIDAALEIVESSLAVRRLPAPGEESEAPLDLLALMEDPGERARRAGAELRFRNTLASFATGNRMLAFVPHLVQGEERGTPELVFLRSVLLPEGEEAIQGIWMDWRGLERRLLFIVREFYAQARLVPTRGTGASRLVTIPFLLEAGPVGGHALEGWTPTRLALLGLWTAFAAGALATGVTLAKTLELSERRRAFVSAVTHELRTPLTTFCMYSELLADGVVTDPAAQREYFHTLKDESVRLRRIVENVLGYARLEGRHSRRPLARVAPEDLIDRVLPALERRAHEAGLELVPDVRIVPGALVEVEVQAVEQILFNLVDNAAKYGKGGEASIVLEAITTRDELKVRVLDHGPGVPPGVRRSIFAPFRRAAGDAEGSIPGIGLGLALARGMAQSMGGDVSVETRAGFGGVFELALPLRASAR